MAVRLWFLALCPVVAMMTAGPASAEPSAADICNQVAFGVPPGQVADSIHRGDPRINIFMAGQMVWEALKTCE